MSAIGTVAPAGGAGTDARLVSRTKDGDEAAFEELYRRYRQSIRGFVARRVGDDGSAEDLTQEVFLSALRALRAGDAEILWGPWLYAIARNATIDFHRRKSSEELPLEDAELLRSFERPRLAGPPAPEAELESKERFEHLRGAFAELPPSHHRILVMRELEGLSYREIGDRLELTGPAVESKLFRARRRLAREYEDLQDGRRCQAARATMGLIAEGVDPGAERRRMARHARRCTVCRRRAAELGIEIGRLRGRAAAFLPLGWLLPRCGNGPAEPTGGVLLLGSGGQLGAGFVERAAALVAAAAMAASGSLAISNDPVAPAPLRAAAPPAAQAPAHPVPGAVPGAPAGPRRPREASQRGQPPARQPSRPTKRVQERRAAPAPQPFEAQPAEPPAAAALARSVSLRISIPRPQADATLTGGTALADAIEPRGELSPRPALPTGAVVPAAKNVTKALRG